MPLIRVDDPSDPRLIGYRDIRDTTQAGRRSLFVAEGRLVVERLLGAPRFMVRSILVDQAGAASLSASLAGHPALDVFVVTQAVMNGIAGFNVHRGCLALAERPALEDWRGLAATARRLLVCERISDPDNCGALFRNAAAFAVDAVLLGPGCVDPLYRKAIRTSMAAVFTLPFAFIAPWPDALRLLRQQHLVIAMTPAADAAAIRDVRNVRDVRRRRLTVLVGNEGDGLTDAALAAADHRVRVPMAGGVDSLNVATAAAIAFYELAQE